MTATCGFEHPEPCEPGFCMMPPLTVGNVVHAVGGHGVSTCMNCGWRGVASTYGGTLVGKPRRYFSPGTPAAFARVDSQISHLCPVCNANDEDPADLSGIQREVVKIGRNEPCHCGSGKKYKKCHGR